MVVPKPFFWLMLGLALIGGGIFFLRSNSSSKETIEVIRSQNTQVSTSKLVNVDISGAVVNSGVYALPDQSRIADALTSAGGLASEADTVWVEANINRAQVLVDGQKIFIPKLADEFSANTVLGTENSMKTGNEKISINSASQSELESLPQVGPVTAQKIIANRPYASLGELVSKKAISQSVYTKISNLIQLW